MDIIPLLKSQPFINVVGNAASILNKNNGELIDQYFTVRFNIYVFTDEKKQGTRTDVLVSNQSRTSVVYNNNPNKINFTKILSQEKHKKVFDNFCSKNNCKLYTIPNDVTVALTKLYPSSKIIYQKAIYNNINKEVKEIIRTTTRSKTQDASIGFIFLHYMFINNINNINIFGFDWKETNSLHTSGQFIGPHNFAFEKEKIMEWGEKLNWLIY